MGRALFTTKIYELIGANSFCSHLKSHVGISGEI